MNAKIVGGGIAVVAVAAALYFGVFSGGGSSTGGDPALGKERAEKFLASVKAKGGEATYGAAEASGEGVVIKNIVFKGKDPSGKPMDATVGELRIKRYDWANPAQPAYMEGEYREVRIPALADNPQFKEFSSVTGLKELLISARVDYAFDKGTKTVELKTGDITVDGMGTLSFTGKIDGIDVAQIEALQGAPDPGKVMGMVAAMRIHGLRIAFKDAGATAKVLKFGAHKEKKTEDEIRNQALARIAQGKSVPVKVGRDAAAAAESFIKSPGTFVIEAQPKAPFAIAQLMALTGKFDPAAIDKMAEDLGLSIKAQ